MTSTNVLITGANRGIGRGLLELYLTRPNHTIIAAVRDPNHATAKELTALSRSESTSLITVKLDLTIPSDPARAVTELANHGIDRIDILVANAAIALKWVKVSEVTTDDIQQHVDVNVYGFVRLFQAFLPVLQKSKDPKFVTIGSCAAFLTNFIPMKNAAYAPTKVVQHWLTKAIHTEEPWLTSFPVDPGWVQTDLGQRGAHAFGYEKAAITVDDSVNGIIKVIDASTRETHGGKLWVYTGQESPW
ncbi:NAD(P)-binding protein [Parathielavia appendiculata]|uniref:NAD(P)-binding protein n=1 Tax=Parathielavia appendiculata TaxID=2587402 RepID=A0AAN6Z2X3_9PEZI|nr:NAD(P)-binding protein [Parathielavia appendiculata]